MALLVPESRPRVPAHSGGYDALVWLKPPRGRLPLGPCAWTYRQTVRNCWQECWRGPHISMDYNSNIPDANEAAGSLKEESIGPSAQSGLSQG